MLFLFGKLLNKICPLIIEQIKDIKKVRVF